MKSDALFESAVRPDMHPKSSIFDEAQPSVVWMTEGSNMAKLIYHLLLHGKDKEKILLVKILDNFGPQNEAGELSGLNCWPNGYINYVGASSGNIEFCRSILNSAVRY